MLYLSTETSLMITEKYPSLLDLGSTVLAPCILSCWCSPPSSFSHLSPHWVFCSGKCGSLLLQALLDQRYQCPVPFYTTYHSRRCPTTSICIWHFSIPQMRWSDHFCPFLCPDEQMRTSSFAVIVNQ